MGSSGGPRSVPTTSTSTQSGTTSSTGTQSNQVPDWVRAAGPDIFGQAQGAANTFANNPLLAQMQGNAAQIGATAPGFLTNARGGNFAQSAIEQLMGIGGGAGGYSAMGAGGGAGGVDRGSVRDTNWRNFRDYNVDDYMNPYTQNVVDASVGDVQRNARMSALQRGSEAQRAGSFGGARHGVLDALAGGETTREIGNLTSRLRSDAYNNATGLIGRDQMGDFGSQQSNQQADLGVANLNMQDALGRANAAASFNASSQNSRVQALMAALQGGINLGGLDVTQGVAGQNALQGGLSASMLPFEVLRGLGGMLRDIPTDQNSTSSNTSTSTQTGSGTGQQVVDTPDSRSANWGTALMLMSMFI